MMRKWREIQKEKQKQNRNEMEEPSFLSLPIPLLKKKMNFAQPQKKRDKKNQIKN